jgi:threonine dehydratase
VVRLVTLGDIEDARTSVAPVIRATPVHRSENLSRVAGRRVALKPEHLQRTGSFKVRGAYNHISRLRGVPEVVAASAGNHAQGVALAATLSGLRSVIYMPTNAALPKVDATQGYGAEVRLVGDTVDDCVVEAQRHAAETGARYVPPFDDPLVIAGQGTIGLELVEEAPEASVMVVPVGGGGLIAGVATAVKAKRPDMRVVGVEAVGAPTVRASLDAGCVVTLDQVNTMADGTVVRACSELTLAHVRAHVDDIVLVSEEAISRALLLLLERAKWVVEPAGALALAGILDGAVPGEGPAVAVCTGGNVDPLVLTKLIEHGLSAAGRYLRLRVVLGDRPGALARLLMVIAASSANVLDISHHRAGVPVDVTDVEVLIVVETRSPAHRSEVLAAVAAAGYQATVA